MTNCLFCRIASGEIPASKVFENEHTIVFKDIDPKAPVHLLVIPKIHVATIHEIPENQSLIMAHLFKTVQTVVCQEKLTAQGYRIVINSGHDAGQAVDHLHIHILAGRILNWPPG